MKTLIPALLAVVVCCVATAQDCPDGRCPVRQSTPASMYAVAAEPTQQTQSSGVRVEYFESRARVAIFPRLASIRERKPVRRWFARLLWRY